MVSIASPDPHEPINDSTVPLRIEQIDMMRLLKRSHQGRPIEGRDVAFVAGIVFRFPGTSIGAILRSTNGAPAEARLVAFRPSWCYRKMYRRVRHEARIIQGAELPAGEGIRMCERVCEKWTKKRKGLRISP